MRIVTMNRLLRFLEDLCEINAVNRERVTPLRLRSVASHVPSVALCPKKTFGDPACLPAVAAERRYAHATRQAKDRDTVDPGKRP